MDEFEKVVQTVYFPHEGREVCYLCHKPQDTDFMLRIRTFENTVGWACDSHFELETGEGAR